MSEAITIDAIIDFWFSDYVRQYWFNSTPKFDRIYLLAREGRRVNWTASPLGCLALVLLFDQIPLHMYRGQKQSFATEE